MITKIFYFIVVCLSFIANVNASQQHINDPVELVQNPTGRTSTSLNGQWTHIMDPYETGYYNHRYKEDIKNGFYLNKKVTKPHHRIEYDFSTADKINVPGDWNTQKEQMMFYEGTVWYHKNFTLNKQANKRYVINFGAVNYKALVYVNGVKIGSHEGGFTPFQFDITEQVNKGDNFIIVKVDNRRERDQVPTINTDWWNYGGITRSVSILDLPKTYLADYSIGLSKDNNAVISGSLKIKGQVNTKDKVTLLIPELGINKKINVNKFRWFKFYIFIV